MLTTSCTLFALNICGEKVCIILAFYKTYKPAIYILPVHSSGSGFSINSPFSEAVRWMEFLTAWILAGELLYMEFRRYLYRRKANVTAQSILLAIGYNINKLHHKIQAGRTGRHLFPLKQTAWFWQVKSKSWKRTFFQKRFIKVRLLVETEWKERIFRLKNGKKMLPHLWFPNHWCDSPTIRRFP